MAATRSILDPAARQLLAQHENFHGLCRLLGRLKTNYQLSELVGQGAGALAGGGAGRGYA